MNLDQAQLVAQRNHHAAVACELLLAGHLHEARRHATERRRLAQLLQDRKVPAQ